MANSDLTAERVREVLRYDPVTGQFFWLKMASHRRPAGSRAGYQDPRGYRRITIDKTYFCLEHRLAWLYTYGVWPRDEIDHINGDPSDNRLGNLREVDRRTNGQNQRHAMSHSSHGFLGVARSKKRWKAHIKISGKQQTIGIYDTPEEAHSAYVEAKRRLHLGCTI